MTKDGKLPAESVVENFERRFAGRLSGTLARLLHARIKFENKDFAGAAKLLDTEDFAKKTKLGDYALWLRGRALLFDNQLAAASTVFQQFIEKYPDSILVKDARIGFATADLANTQPKTAEILNELLRKKDSEAYIVMARGAEGKGDRESAVRYYRAAYFAAPIKSNDPVTHLIVDPASEAEMKLTSLAQPLTPSNAEEAKARADKLFAARNFVEADKAYADLASNYASALTPAVNLNRQIAAANAKKMQDAQTAFNAIPASAPEKERAYYELTQGYAKNKLWLQARQNAEEMRQKFPSSKLTPKTWADAGYAARDAKNKGEENYFLQTALTAWPNAVEVAGAQFELAWMEHENTNYARSSQLFIDHLARYVDKDTTNRGKAGYWAARDSERAGKKDDACNLYNAVSYRYAANWYGYLAQQRLGAMACPGGSARDPRLAKAIENLKSVTVAAETSTERELERGAKSDQLSTIGLFDWAIDELEEAKKTAQNSPKINLALARHYRFKGDNVNALLALAKSYPDYSQMFPEEMGREEWEIFYPVVAWDQIAAWAKNRKLDMYQVAGLIRQESVFNPRAKSGANAFGLMQLLIPTARTVARKYGSTAVINSAEDLYQPAVNIELGTAFMRDQLDKFGRIEYMAVAYNAGPGRVAPWRASLPMEIDEFVEAIPFRETKGYVQGVIRNAAQYRRLYDENGNFKPNVGARPLRGEIDSKPREQFTAEFPEIVVEDRTAE